MRGFYKGGITLVLRDFLFGGTMWTIYKSINEIAFQYGDSSIIYLMSGVLAGSIASIITQPFEIVRTKLQACEKNLSKSGKVQRWVIFGMFNEIYQKEGIKGFNKGLVPRLLRKPLMNASTFFWYELISRKGERVN